MLDSRIYCPDQVLPYYALWAGITGHTAGDLAKGSIDISHNPVHMKSDTQSVKNHT